MFYTTKITLAPGCNAFYDNISGISLNMNKKEVSISNGINTSGLIKAVREGKIMVTAGTLNAQKSNYDPTYYRLLDKKIASQIKNHKKAEEVKEAKKAIDTIVDIVEVDKIEDEIKEEPVLEEHTEEAVAEEDATPKKRTRKKKEVIKSEEAKEEE